MTLLVAWTGIDSRGAASVYVATDSRLSWSNKGYFDHAVKTYAMSDFPAILGYCGDALTGQMIIIQANAVVSSLMNPNTVTLKEIAKLFIRSMERSYKEYPIQNTTGSFSVVICGKRKLDSNGDFESYKIISDFKTTRLESVEFPDKSGPLIIAGSGSSAFKEKYRNHCVQDNPNKSTSRDVFHAFTETIKNSKDRTVGPIPQVVSVIRKPRSVGFHCGVVSEQKRYINGQLIDADQLDNVASWFNDKFEITDPCTKQKEIDAQSQPPFSV